jgi:hypothetical protein
MASKQRLFVISLLLVLTCTWMFLLPAFSHGPRLLTPSQSQDTKGGWVCAVLKAIVLTIEVCSIGHEGWLLLKQYYFTHEAPGPTKCEVNQNPTPVRQKTVRVDTGCNTVEVYHSVYESFAVR